MPVTKKAGVLGATGSVGQKFILLLAEHPDFELYKLGASVRSAGKPYAEAVKWRQTATIPESARQLVVVGCKASEFADCDVVFSGLDSDVAGDIEKEFKEFGLVVISNAKNYRREPDVPLVVPLVNSSHLDVVARRVKQARAAGTKPGYIICNSNCSTAGLVVPLGALMARFGDISDVTVTTLQAISGAGFSPGVLGFDILDNVIPYISGEEEKLEWETKKILGSVAEDDSFALRSSMTVSAQCNRVAVSDGHLECVSIKFATTNKPSVEDVKQALRDYICESQTLGCPSAPKQCIYVLDEVDRPQPRLDRNRDNGYAISVGRVREDPVFDFKFIVLSHNTVIGAAGSGILIAETLFKKGLL
ncbi:semialdehyde dehydrogenase [Lipomyces tetrasporus]|uniref:Aspartate-semialdehyde dehydrogenase n=1 Tax=Lipomyces tetrasporus TaxID=54092 RepID=A0AAD7QPT7_9ASCO|nr:semialdehyde dehydrogenase [Lipomyces tetrasporus]KAJ8099372.1 semialdehyde dehydrogenase [Lipomyces tetrasporus]